MGAPSTTFRQTQRKKPPEGGFGGSGRNRLGPVDSPQGVHVLFI